MGSIRKTELGTLLIGFISKDEKLITQLTKILIDKFGPIEHQSTLFYFHNTSYYKEEFGEHLKKQFISFTNTIDPSEIASIKITTNQLEDQFALIDKRQINIDPGYIQLGKLVLATTKNQQHRIYLGQGIFAEVTLRYKGNSFTTWEWTYPDYQSKEYIEVFNKMRDLHYKKTTTK